jgi:hypothetical protein
MGRIIKLTESQLRDMVTRVISEQQASPDASPAAKQIWTNLAKAVNNMGTDEQGIVSAISLIKSVELYTEVVNMMRGPSSISNYKSIVQLLNGRFAAYDYKYFKQIQTILSKIGVTLTAQTSGPAQNPFLKAGTIRQVVGPTAKPGVTPKPDATKPQYRECTGFPIKYGCKQTEVGYVQQCLGLKVDYSFGPDTLKALIGYAPMRNGSTPEGLKKQYVTIGLSKQEFDLIRTKYCKAKPKPKKQASVVDTRDKTTPTTLASRQIQQLPVNIDLPTLEALPSTGVDPTRKAAILVQIKDRGFDKVYKGQPLTPEEKQWLESYLGTQINKDKMKSGGQEKLRLPNP